MRYHPTLKNQSGNKMLCAWLKDICKCWTQLFVQVQAILFVTLHTANKPSHFFVVTH
jgi:hypothetical protein